MENFTKEQVDEMVENAKKEWVEKELNPILKERDELLKFKPKQKTEEEKQLEEKQKELFEKEVYLTLKEHELTDFMEFLNVQTMDELNAKIEKLKKVLDNRKVNNAYVPTDHQKASKYAQYAHEKNTLGMIGEKLAKLFQ